MWENEPILIETPQTYPPLIVRSNRKSCYQWEKQIGLNSALF